MELFGMEAEHILICLSTSPSNPKIIRTAAKLAQATNARMTALFVETGKFKYYSQEDKNRLRENMNIAIRYGAKIETVYGDDIALQIAEYARLSGATKVVVGRSPNHKRLFVEHVSFSERIGELAPNLDVYIVPDQTIPIYNRIPAGTPLTKLSGIDVIKSLGFLVVASLVGLVFQYLRFSVANIIMIYILAVLMTAIVTEGRFYSIVVSVISVLLFNFLFTEPYFSFHAEGAEYPITFLVMFLTAFVISSLTTQIKRQAVHSTGMAYRTQILLDTNQLLQMQKSDKEIIEVTIQQLTKLLKRDVVYYQTPDEEPLWYPVNTNSEYQDERYRSKDEKKVVAWVFENRKHAGAGTTNMPDAIYHYLALRSETSLFGVVGINMNGEELTSFENSMLLSVLGECALAMEKELYARKREEAATQAKNEQLRADLLRSISHDLRTPLTGISGNAGMLLELGEKLDEEKKKQLYGDIYDDSMWLINLVENLLSITRIENGTMKLHMQTEVIEEVIEEAVSHGNRKQKEHKITVVPQDELLLAKIDVRLILQVLVNLIDNAVKYTQIGSEITITTQAGDGFIIIDVADDGPGVPDDKKEKIFEMFYTENNGIVDSRRGMGLGLALCRSIVNAHDGTIEVLDNVPRGTIFRITLPSEEAVIHE